MSSVNPKILEKIEEIVGKNAPEELMEFFKEILQTEIRAEVGSYDSKKIKDAYKTSVEKWASKQNILDYIGDDKN